MRTSSKTSVWDLRRQSPAWASAGHGRAHPAQAMMDQSKALGFAYNWVFRNLQILSLNWEVFRPVMSPGSSEPAHSPCLIACWVKESCDCFQSSARCSSRTQDQALHEITNLLVSLPFSAGRAWADYWCLQWVNSGKADLVLWKAMSYLRTGWPRHEEDACPISWCCILCGWGEQGENNKETTTNTYMGTAQQKKRLGRARAVGGTEFDCLFGMAREETANTVMYTQRY